MNINRIEYLQVEHFNIVLSGYDARIEIVPTVIYYPRLGVDGGNLVGVELRIITEKVTGLYQWTEQMATFSRLYEDLKEFPAPRETFEFPNSVEFLRGQGVWCKVQPVGRSHWAVRCELRNGFDSPSLEETQCSAGVRFRLNMSELNARQQTADFLRFAASLAEA